MNTTSSRLILIMAKTWVVFAAFFGTNLYFSLNHNINNPQVHWFVPVLKDLVWLAIVAATYFFSDQRRLNRIALVIIGVNVLFNFWIFGLVFFTHGRVDISYIKFSKNVFLYLGLAIIYVNLIMNLDPKIDFFKSVRNTITASMVVGMVFFFFHPIQSVDLRIYGTFGNPTSLGFTAVLAVALSFMHSDEKMGIVDGIHIAISSFGVLLAGSLSAFAALLAIYPTGMFLSYWYSSDREKGFKFLVFKLIPGYLGFLMMIGAVNGLCWISGHENQIAVRIGQFVSSARGSHTIHPSDSIKVRKKAFDKMFLPTQENVTVIQQVTGMLPKKFYRADSALLCYLYHFGWIGVGLMLVPIAISLFFILQLMIHPPFSTGRQMGWFAALIVLFCIFNLPFQFQYDVFPTNFFYTLVIGTLILEASRIFFERKQLKDVLGLINPGMRSLERVWTSLRTLHFRLKSGMLG